MERTRAELRAEIARGFPEYGRLVAPLEAVMGRDKADVPPIA